MTLLSPSGLLLALGAVLPLAAVVLAARRVERARAALGLEPPPARGAAAAAALVAVPLLLALAAAQPAVRRTDERRVRTDAEAFVVVDVSRSMLAAAAPGAPTRLARAKEVALRVREALGPVPTGVAGMTDRVLPHLFATADTDAFAETVSRALAPESPPPREVNVTATTLAALSEAARGNLFAPRSRRRLFVVLTDGESRPFAESAVARTLAANRIALVAVHVWRDGERVWTGGVAERLYRPDPRSGEVLAALAAAARGAAFEEDEVGEAAGAAARALGTGPTEGRGTETRVVPLAPYVALAALLPLALVLRRRNLR